MRAKTVRVCIVTGYGINADRELAEAFRRAGAEPLRVHVTDLLESPESLSGFSILAFPGGFSFGDHLGSGKVLAYLVKSRLKSGLETFVARGGLILGICNGFQTLVKMGILPNLSGALGQEVSLIHNESGSFIDCWVDVKFNTRNSSPWLRDLSGMSYPVRHGEGRFITGSKETAEALKTRNLIALTYAGRNPNGSELDIAGISDPSGRIVGMMPHPEAFLVPENHPQWRRQKIAEEAGLLFFENAVKACRG